MKDPFAELLKPYVGLSPLSLLPLLHPSHCFFCCHLEKLKKLQYVDIKKLLIIYKLHLLSICPKMIVSFTFSHVLGKELEFSLVSLDWLCRFGCEIQLERKD